MSPLLWLMFFNDAPERLERFRASQGAGAGAARYYDSLFADDVTTLIIGPELPPVREGAVTNASNVTNTLGAKFLRVQIPKTRNILLRPGFLSEGVYWRAPPVLTLTAETRLRNQYHTEAPCSRAMLDFDPFEHPPLRSHAIMDAEGFPFPLEDPIRVLGVVFDDHFAMDAHVQGV